MDLTEEILNLRHEVQHIKEELQTLNQKEAELLIQIIYFITSKGEINND